jgi:hypothetical protein
VGLSCARHGIPMLSVNMITGEQYVYADFLLSLLIKKLGTDRKYYVFYDISCSYSKKFHVSPFLSILNAISLLMYRKE